MPNKIKFFIAKSERHARFFYACFNPVLKNRVALRLQERLPFFITGQSA